MHWVGWWLGQRKVTKVTRDSDSIGVGSAFGDNDGTLLREGLVVVVGLVGRAEYIG